MARRTVLHAVPFRLDRPFGVDLWKISLAAPRSAGAGGAAHDARRGIHGAALELADACFVIEMNHASHKVKNGSRRQCISHLIEFNYYYGL